MPDLCRVAIASWALSLLAVFIVLPVSADAASHETVLHSFSVTEGSGADGVLVGRDGVLYGTLAKGGPVGGGSVYALKPPTPPSTKWQYWTIYSFPTIGPALAMRSGTPDPELIQDRQGRLLGTTANGGQLGGGIAFMLTPTASGDWIETTLHSFSKSQINKSGVVAGSHGALFGSVGTVVDIPLDV